MTLSIKHFIAILAASLILVGVVGVTAGVLTSRTAVRVATTWTEFENHTAAKSDLVAELRRALGYGGMIHNFKNMILRRDARRVEVVRANAKAAERALEAYRGVGVNTDEAQSLQAIGAVIKSYGSSTDMAEQMINAGKTAAEIDPIVKIDDGPALAGFAKLDEHLRAMRQASTADVHTTLDDVQATAIGAAIMTTLLLAGTIIAFIRFSHARLLRPMGDLGDAMRRLATGATDIEIPGSDRQDEIGCMAAAVQVFKQSLIANEQLQAERTAESEAKMQRAQRLDQLMQRLETRVGGLVQSLSSASVEMEATAQSMSSTAEQSNRQAIAVVSSAEQTSSSVQMVATATEELTSSIGEIGRQATDSSRIAGKAVDDAKQTDDIARALAAGAQKIGEVVSLINEIAGQTGLLALNATIEAARAGEAGRGFAVVAGEVKLLATQTGKATEEIAAQIEHMQDATKQAVASIQDIGATIQEMNRIAAAIAAAVEEQVAATREITRNVQEAARGTQEVTGNLVRVKGAAKDTGEAASRLLGAAGQLSRNSGELRTQVDEFIAAAKAA